MPPQSIQLTKNIQAPSSIIWNYLTNPDLMKQWMGEEEMQIEINTDWKTGSSIVIKGFHHIEFENTGTILQVEPLQTLKYNHLSSLSQLPYIAKNYTIMEFKLVASGNQTLLSLTLTNFPTESIFKHLDFYWKTTLEIMKNLIERESLDFK